jgi:hypothetical protein
VILWVYFLITTIRKWGAIKSKCLGLGRDTGLKLLMTVSETQSETSTFQVSLGFFCTFFKFNSQPRNSFLKNCLCFLVQLPLSYYELLDMPAPPQKNKKKTPWKCTPFPKMWKSLSSYGKHLCVLSSDHHSSNLGSSPKNALRREARLRSWEEEEAEQMRHMWPEAHCHKDPMTTRFLTNHFNIFQVINHSMICLGIGK